MPVVDIPNESPAPPPACEGCERVAVTAIDGKGWCVDCFHERGSCCSGE